VSALQAGSLWYQQGSIGILPVGRVAAPEYRLEDYATFRTMTPIDWLRTKSRELLQLKDKPHAIAIGTAVGIFFGFIPLWGLKTLLALGVVRLLRGNLVAAAISVTLHDVALPLMPLLLRWEYDVGYWLLSHPHELPSSLRVAHQNPATWFHWSTFLTVGRPLLLGSLVIAAPTALAIYYLTFFAVGRSKRKQTASSETSSL
jgi:uncharacterized protein